GRRGGARARLVAAHRVALLLRHRLRVGGRDDRRPRERRAGAGGDRRHVARLPVARRAAGVDAAPLVGALPRLPDARVPDRAAGGRPEAAVRDRPLTDWAAWAGRYGDPAASQTR